MIFLQMISSNGDVTVFDRKNHIFLDVPCEKDKTIPCNVKCESFGECQISKKFLNIGKPF